MSETNRAGDSNARTDTDELRGKKTGVHTLGPSETHILEDDAVILTDGGQTDDCDWPSTEDVANDSEPVTEESDLR